MYPELLTHCCYQKQLNQIYTSFDHALRTLGTAVSVEVPAEPEVTLSALIDWLIYETPHADIYLNLNTFTTPLIETLNALLLRRNVQVGRQTTPLINHIYLSLPKSAVTETNHHFFADHASLVTLTLHEPSAGGPETLTLTSDCPRRLQFVTNSVAGQLDQFIGTRIRKLTFRSQKQTLPSPPVEGGR